VVVDAMKTIGKQVLSTSRNFLRISVRLVPQDQREAIRPSIIISHYTFITKDGQAGYVIISHTAKRAGICFSEVRSTAGPVRH
jgi:hypothetical protein